MHLTVFTTFPLKQIWLCPLNIFDKSTPVASAVPKMFALAFRSVKDLL